MPEFVKTSGAGFIYETDEELLSAMDQLVDDPSYRHELGVRGYQAYQERWSPDVHLKRYFDIINEIVATRQHKL